MSDSPVTITTRENGPLLVSGPAVLVDHLGRKFDLAGKETFALCRCSHSKKRPFCDGTHKTTGFAACETAPPSA